MFCKTCIALGLVVISMTPTVTNAQEIWERITGGVGAGIALPLNEEYEPVGSQADVSVGYQLTPQITGLVGLSYFRLDFENGEVVRGVTQFQSIESIYGAVQYANSLSRGLTHYFLGGVGLYDISRDTRVESSPVTPLGDTFVGVLEGISVTKLGFLAGTGLEKVVYQKGEKESSFAVSIFGEGRFHFVLTSDPLKLATVSFGLRFSVK